MPAGKQAWPAESLLHEPLLDALAGSFSGYQLIENCQNLLAVVVRATQFLPHGQFIPMPAQELVEEFLGHIYIAPERLRRVPAQKQPIEECRLALRRQRIDFFVERHALLSN